MELGVSDKNIMVWGSFGFEIEMSLWNHVQHMNGSTYFWTHEKDVLAQMEGLGGDKAKAWSARKPDSEKLNVQIWKHQTGLKLTIQIWTGGKNLAPN